MCLVPSLFSISLLARAGPQTAVPRPHPARNASSCLVLDLLNQELWAGPEVRVLIALQDTQRRLPARTPAPRRPGLTLPVTVSSASPEAPGLHRHAPSPEQATLESALCCSFESSLLGRQLCEHVPRGQLPDLQLSEAPPLLEGQFLGCLVPTVDLSLQG